MQLFELLLLVSIIIFLFSRGYLQQKIKDQYLLILLGLILTGHLILEGYRWQMLPTYLLTLICMIVYLRPYKPIRSLWLKSFQFIGILILIIPAFILPSVLPVFSLPESSGEFNVGTRDLHIELEREEPVTTNTGDQREFMVKVWYPTEDNSGTKDPYVDAGGRHGFALKYGLPASAFNYLDKVDSHVFREATIANGTFPVLIFSHGYNSKANGYYALLTELASQGYVIFSINHTYESTGATFPDGKEVYFNYDYAQRIEHNTWHLMQPVKEAFASKQSFAKRHPIVKKGLTTYFVKDILERWSNDIIDVVDQLDEWNSQGPFQGKLNTDAIGVFGHSRGGGAAGHAHLKDSRIKAAANVDGVQWGDIVNTAFEQPFLYISADWPESHEDLNSHAYVHKSTEVFYEAKILNTGHSNFMDIPLMIPYTGLSEAGTINPKKGLEITNSLLTEFFGHHLKTSELGMDDLSTEFQELELNIYKGRRNQNITSTQTTTTIN